MISFQGLQSTGIHRNQALNSVKISARQVAVDHPRSASNKSIMENSPPSLTPQQRAALHAVDRSVSLSAGAGCGKTFVLTERFLAEVSPGSGSAALDEVVAITFTEAAAREMRSRVRARCRERLEAAPPQDRASWQSLVRQLDAARISTIHSFCAQLLRTHAVEAGPRSAVRNARSGGVRSDAVAGGRRLPP